MKGKIVGLLTVVLFLLASCGTGQKQASAKISAGEQAVKNEQYSKAAAEFTEALKFEPKNAQGKIYLEEVKTFQLIEKKIDQLDYVAAKDLIESLVRDGDGLTVLQDRARKLLTGIRKDLALEEKYVEIYNHALSLNQSGDFQASNEKLSAFDHKEIFGQYFTSLRNKAKHLMEKNNQAVAMTNADKEKAATKQKAKSNKGKQVVQKNKDKKGTAAKTPEKQSENNGSTETNQSGKNSEAALSRQAQNVRAVANFSGNEKTAIDLIVSKLNLNPAFYNFQVRDEGDALFIALIEDHVASGEGDPNTSPTVDNFKFDIKTGTLYRSNLDGTFEAL